MCHRDFVRKFCVALIVASVFVPSVFADQGLTLISPLGGQTFYVGDSITVSWKLDPGISVTGPLVFISPNNGKKKAYLAKYEGAVPADGICSLRIKIDSTGTNPLLSSTVTFSMISDSCICIVADYNGNGSDQSTSIFSIKRKPQSVKRFLSPIGGSASLILMKPQAHGTMMVTSLFPQQTQFALFEASGRKIYSGILESQETSAITIPVNQKVFVKAFAGDRMESFVIDGVK